MPSIKMFIFATIKCCNNQTATLWCNNNQEISIWDKTATDYYKSRGPKIESFFFWGK